MNPAPRRAVRRHEQHAAQAARDQYRAGKRRCKTAKKTRLADFERAVAAALRLSVVLGRPIRAYSCEECGGWHLTKRPTPPKDTR